MSVQHPPYTHQDLVTAVWYKTIGERDKNPTLAHLNEMELLRCVAIVLTPDGINSLIKVNPGLREQFARTVAWWRKETNQQTEG